MSGAHIMEKRMKAARKLADKEAKVSESPKQEKSNPERGRYLDREARPTQEK